jgi:hypothetical protein
MSERNYLGAVDMFTNSLDLVFSDKLVAFHAITGVRNALMECKQTIEDHLVHELHYIIYSKVSIYASIATADSSTDAILCVGSVRALLKSEPILAGIDRE